MPQLVGTRDINGRGFFVRLPIGSPAGSQITLVFVPPGFQPRPTLDLIVFLHGFTSHSDVREYFGDPARQGMWAGIEASHKNVVLAAPSLGPNPEAGSQLTQARPSGGNLGLADFIDQVLLGMAEFGPQATGGGTPGTSSLPPLRSPDNVPAPAPPRLGNLILAGHSAGGKPLVDLANLAHRYQVNLRECWCFDGWYYGSDLWIAWLRGNATKRLRGFYIAGTGTQATARAIAGLGLPNVTLQADPGGNHDSEPSRLLGGLVQSSSYLSGTP
jgi:hypothetical protein